MSKATVSAYMLTKAERLLEVGAVAYRREDFFGMPPEDWGEARTERLLDGCRQLLAGLGADQEAPLEGLGVEGAHDLAGTFHFLVRRVRTDVGEGFFCDEMRLLHRVTGFDAVVFNRIRRD